MNKNDISDKERLILNNFWNNQELRATKMIVAESSRGNSLTALEKRVNDKIQSMKSISGSTSSLLSNGTQQLEKVYLTKHFSDPKTPEVKVTDPELQLLSTVDSTRNLINNLSAAVKDLQEWEQEQKRQEEERERKREKIQSRQRAAIVCFAIVFMIVALIWLLQPH